MTQEASTLTIPGTLADISRLRSWLEEILEGKGVSDKVTADLQLAVTEFCTNIVRHGYGEEGIGEIEISVQTDESNIRVTIVDSAPAFAPAQLETDPVSGLSEGGRGVFLVNELTDEITHEIVGGGGNSTTLVKRLRF